MKIFDSVNFILDFLFPTICPVCGEYTDKKGICYKCRSLMEVDFHILKKENFILYFMTRYHNEYVREMLHAVKYRRMKYIAEDIGYSMGYALKNSIDVSFYDYIVPVPMHFFRWVNRGFNQSEIIGEKISEICGLPVFDKIKRKKYTKKMANLSPELRKENIKNAFYIKEEISGNFLVIDDIFTTGSTFIEISNTLKNGGANRVDIFVYSYAG